jgi:antitoxin HigA-1
MTSPASQACVGEILSLDPGTQARGLLLEELLKPFGISQNKLRRDIKVPPRRVNGIVLGKRSVTPDTALRLARYFGTSERFWLGLQMDYDLEEARRRIADT